MSEEADLESLEKEAWELKKKFLAVVERHRSSLWQYCRMLTGSHWDAEDLVQDTLMKAMASLGQIWQPIMPKTYLFRIATNTWINNRRKQKAVFSSYVFDFTAGETAELVGSTEGAIKAALHRARTNLKKTCMEKVEPVKRGSKMSEKDRDLTKSFVDAFNRKDPDAIADLLADHAITDIVHIGQEFGKKTIRKHSISDLMKHPEINSLKAEPTELWGKPVVVIQSQKNTSKELVEIYSFDFDDHHISCWKTYCFCKDLLQEAGKELGLTVPGSVANLPE